MHSQSESMRYIIALNQMGDFLDSANLTHFNCRMSVIQERSEIQCLSRRFSLFQ